MIVTGEFRHVSLFEALIVVVTLRNGSRRGLFGPRLGFGVVDVDGGLVRRIGVQDVDGIREFGEEAEWEGGGDIEGGSVGCCYVCGGRYRRGR